MHFCVAASTLDTPIPSPLISATPHLPVIVLVATEVPQVERKDTENQTGREGVTIIQNSGWAIHDWEARFVKEAPARKGSYT